MLSYQHMYHAGGLADVQKHAALTLILGKMVEKEKSLSYMETHAGRGVYDLNSVEANKTKEAAAGILALLKQARIPISHPYIQLLERVKSQYGLNCYPGSPLIARMLLRPEDPLYLMELHPREHEVLVKNMRAKNVHIYRQDGYQQVLALAPPSIGRGLVLIDPSYEIKEEYQTAAEFILQLHKKWPETAILLWYPILSKQHHVPMLERLRQVDAPKFWQQEIIFNNTRQRALGTGLIGINLPYGIELELQKIACWL